MNERQTEVADYITTYTKVHFTPLGPVKEDLRIEDIAHALSLMTRANGHFPEFYSVGQHCVACCEEAMARGYSTRLSLACLLHDAAEAYLADVTRPVKAHMPDFQEIEERLLSVIYEHFLGSTLSDEEEACVKDVDDTLLYHEFLHYMGEELRKPQGNLCSTPVFETVPFGDVEEAYLRLFRKLKNR